MHHTSIMLQQRRQSMFPKRSLIFACTHSVVALGNRISLQRHVLFRDLSSELFSLQIHFLFRDISSEIFSLRRILFRHIFSSETYSLQSQRWAPMISTVWP